MGGGFVLPTNHNRAGEVNLPQTFRLIRGLTHGIRQFSTAATAWQESSRGWFLFCGGQRGRSAERCRRRGAGAILSPCGRRVGPAGRAPSPAPAGREARPAGRVCRWLLLANVSGRKEPAAGSSWGTGRGRGRHCRGRWPRHRCAPLTERGGGAVVPGAAPQWRLRARAKLVLSRRCAGRLNIKLIPSSEDKK